MQEKLLQRNFENDDYLKEKGIILIPSKYLVLIPQYRTIDKFDTIYRLQKRHRKKCILLTKEEKQFVSFLGIIFPSGRISIRSLAQTKENKEIGTISYCLKKKQKKKFGRITIQEIQK